MKSQLCFLTVLATVVANVVPGVVPSSRAAISNAVDSPKSTTLLAQESGFDYRNYAFWAQQCLFLSEGADPEKTLETCETAISIRPRRKNLELWFARSLALFQLGDYAEAIASFGKVVDTAPQDSISIAYQCASFHQLSQWEQAVETCEEALEIDGNWGTDSPAIAWYYRALALQSMGRLTTALSSYERALALTPDDLTIRAGRCALAAELDQGDRCTLAEAMVAYEQVLAETPDNATLWFQQGLALEQLGKYEQALASYEGAIAITPDDSLTLAHQCGVLNQIGEFEAALAACDAALAGNGHWDGLGPVFGWSQRSSAQLGLEAYELALASADRAISIDDSYPGGWNHRAVSLWHLGHL
ncbi:MAG: tetratricopeptide repeat protein, partial [Cyanobacteria bacterium J06597_16]